MSSESDNKRAKVEPKSRAHIIASIQNDYRAIVVAQLPVIKKFFEEHMNDVRSKSCIWKELVNADLLIRIEFFVDYCYTLQGIRRSIQNLNKFITLTDGYVCAIDDQEASSGMVRTVVLLESMSRKLTKHVHAVYEITATLTSLYSCSIENLNEKLKAFMLPWLNPLCRDPLTESIQAFEALNLANPVRDNASFRGEALKELQNHRRF